MQKGTKKKFLGYIIQMCLNGDGVVLLKPGANNYECHLGNYGTDVDSAKKAAIIYYMVARPEIFATSILQKVMGSGGTMHEYYLLKKSLEKDGLKMPKEITILDSMNCLIGFKGKEIRWRDK